MAQRQRFNHTKAPLVNNGEEYPEKIHKCQSCDSGYIRCKKDSIPYIHLCRVCRGHSRHEPLTDMQLRKANYWNSQLIEDWTIEQPFLQLPTI